MCFSEQARRSSSNAFPALGALRRWCIATSHTTCVETCIALLKVSGSQRSHRGGGRLCRGEGLVPNKSKRRTPCRSGPSSLITAAARTSTASVCACAPAPAAQLLLLVVVRVAQS